METNNPSASPERTRLERPVILYDEDFQLYAPLVGPNGPIFLNSDDVPQLDKKSSLLKSGNNYYAVIKPFSDMRTLSRKIAENKFKGIIHLHPDDTVIVKKIPSWKKESGQYEVYEVTKSK